MKMLDDLHWNPLIFINCLSFLANFVCILMKQIGKKTSKQFQLMGLRDNGMF